MKPNYVMQSYLFSSAPSLFAGPFRRLLMFIPGNHNIHQSGLGSNAFASANAAFARALGLAFDCTVVDAFALAFECLFS